MSDNLLGEVVTWDLKATATTHKGVRQALTDAGLDPNAARDLKIASAFSRACRDLKNERAIDKLDYAGGKIRFQFTKRQLEATSGHLKYDYECVLTLDPQSGAIECSENPALEVEAKKLLDAAVEARNAQDVTRLVQRLFMEHADLYPINPRKGVAYFVPERHREFTSKVDDFLRRLGGCLSRFPVPKGTVEGNASVRDAVQTGLSTLLDELNGAVNQWDDKTRKVSMDKAVKDWERIKYKVDVYQEYLGSEQARLLQGLEEAKAQLAQRIHDLSPEEEPATASSAA